MSRYRGLEISKRYGLNPRWRFTYIRRQFEAFVQNILHLTLTDKPFAEESHYMIIFRML